jgi:hypothetical protein
MSVQASEHEGEEDEADEGRTRRTMENPSRLQVPLEVLLMRALPSLDVDAQT